MSFLCSISFSTFGILLLDPAIIIPNVIGIILSCINIITLCILPKEIPEEKKKEKKEIEISPLDFKKINTEKENEYKIPSTDRDEENNIGITDRDQPAAYEQRNYEENNIGITDRDQPEDCDQKDKE